MVYETNVFIRRGLVWGGMRVTLSLLHISKVREILHISKTK